MRSKYIGNWFAELPERRSRFLAVGHRSHTANSEYQNFATVPVGRDERQRRRFANDRPDRELVRCFDRNASIIFQQFARVIELMDNETGKYFRAHRVHLEFKI